MSNKDLIYNEFIRLNYFDKDKYWLTDIDEREGDLYFYKGYYIIGVHFFDDNFFIHKNFVKCFQLYKEYMKQR